MWLSLSHGLITILHAWIRMNSKCSLNILLENAITHRHFNPMTIVWSNTLIALLTPYWRSELAIWARYHLVAHTYSILMKVISSHHHNNFVIFMQRQQKVFLHATYFPRIQSVWQNGVSSTWIHFVCRRFNFIDYSISTNCAISGSGQNWI